MLIRIKSDAINQWVKKERHGEYSFWTPQLVIEGTQFLILILINVLARRKTDDVEDPFRSVLFDDMRPYLFELSHSESKQLLILSFLHFLGFPLLRAFPLQSTDISPLYTFWDPQSLSGSSDDVLFEFPVASVQSSFSALFSDAPWFKAMNKEQIKFVQNSGILKKEFIRNVLEQAGGLPELHGKLVPSALIFEGAFEHKR